MRMKKYKPAQIVTLLRQIELEIANGKTTPQACRDAEITAQTYYRWRKESGGLKLDQAKRLKELERENGYCESFNGKLRDECLNGEIFYSLKEAQIVTEKWRVLHNTLRPHSGLGYRPPAPAALAPQMAALRSPPAPCKPPFAPLSDEVVM